MEIKILETESPNSLMPVCQDGNIGGVFVAGGTFESARREKLESFLSGKPGVLLIAANLWPSADLCRKIAGASSSFSMVSEVEGELLRLEIPGRPDGEDIPMDEASLVVKYPWQLLPVNEELVGGLQADDIQGKVYDGVHIEGRVKIGKGTVLLPGVFIEGNAVIGENCKIGPNCYIRGNTSVGDKCHIGQAVEVKNSVIMNKVSIGHLSYVGDSVICSNTNFGAGTITSNLRHDGKNHRSMVHGELVDTGRRKFGCIVGENVHTGIHTAIYPGRKIWPDATTRPGEIVDRDIVV